MKNKLLASILFLLACSVISKAQYFQDAYRFSNSNYGFGNTARVQSIGGAQIALGGDISSAVLNPAGLGFFNKSVFVFTPSIDFGSADTKFGIIESNGLNNQARSDQTFKNNFNIANIGTVINFGKGRFTDDKFKGGSLAISLNRNSSYHLNRTYQGENNFNSYGDALANDAGLTSPSFYEGLDNTLFYDQAAYLSYLISPSYDGDNNLEGYFADYDGFPIQKETIKQRGSHYQIHVAWGGNYDDKLYFGGGMSTQILNYKETRDYEEFGFGSFDENSDFVSDSRLNAIYTDSETSIRGVGINFNVGLIFRPIEFITIGATYTSPGFISLEEESFFDFEVDWKSGALYNENSDMIDLDAEERLYQSSLFANQYRLRTPSKLGLGTAFFIGKSGFLTTDLEFIDYSKSEINSDDFSIAEDNDLINSQYQLVMNIRVGGEYRFDNFRLSAGYAFFPDPIKDSSLQERTNISFGIGYRTFDYFLDFAVVSSTTQQQAFPYFIPNDQPVATTDIRNTIVSVTFGLTF